jgi:hypothetical protein
MVAAGRGVLHVRPCADVEPVELPRHLALDGELLGEALGGHRGVEGARQVLVVRLALEALEEAQDGAGDEPANGIHAG